MLRGISTPGCSSLRRRNKNGICTCQAEEEQAYFARADLITGRMRLLLLAVLTLAFETAYAYPNDLSALGNKDLWKKLCGGQLCVGNRAT